MLDPEIQKSSRVDINLMTRYVGPAVLPAYGEE